MSRRSRKSRTSAIPNAPDDEPCSVAVADAATAEPADVQSSNELNFNDLFAELEREFSSPAVATATEAPVTEWTSESTGDDVAPAATEPDTEQTAHVSPAAAFSLDDITTVVTSACDDLQTQLSDVCDRVKDEIRASTASLCASTHGASADTAAVLQVVSEAVAALRPTTPPLSSEILELALGGIEQRLLERIESVAELVRLVHADADSIGQRQAASQAPSPDITVGTFATPGRVESADVAPAEVKPAPEIRISSLSVKPGSGVRMWAEIRNEMLAAGGEFHTPQADLRLPEPVRSTPAAIQVPEPVAVLPAVPQLTSDRHFRLPEQDPALEVPRSIDPDSLTLDELRDEFRGREVFIATLISRMRRQQEAATQQLSQEQLRQLLIDLPEELATQVRYTLKQLNDLARVGELELSLERARIARQINQLEHSRQTIERHARQVGMELNADCTLSTAVSNTQRGSSSRRWLGKLGFGQ